MLLISNCSQTAYTNIHILSLSFSLVRCCDASSVIHDTFKYHVIHQVTRESIALRERAVNVLSYYSDCLYCKIISWDLKKCAFSSSIYRFICLFVSLSIYLIIFLSIYMIVSVCRPVYLLACLFDYVSLFISPLVYVCIHLSVSVYILLPPMNISQNRS